MELKCRGCMKREETMFCLFNTVCMKENTELEKMFTNITYLEIDFNDGLPNQICANCVTSLTAAYEFQQNCKKSENIFKTEILLNCDNKTAINDIKSPEPELSEFLCDSIPEKNNLEPLSIQSPISPTKKSFDSFVCHLCKEVFVNFEHLKIHKIKTHNLEIAKTNSTANNLCCPNCSTIFKTVKKFNNHKSQCIEKTLLECTTCKKPFWDTNLFVAHLVEDHGEENLADKRKFKCAKCSCSYADLHLLEHHQLISHKIDKSPCVGIEDNFICSVCARLFTSKRQLNIHFRAIHDLEKRLKCDQCDKEYFYYNALKVHKLRTHAKKADFICSYCGKTFFTSSELTVHMRKHTGDQKFKCSFSNCDKLFTQSGELKFHIQSKHTGERKFKCSECEKTFITKQHLKQHFERNHFDEPRIRKYACDLCENSFFTQATLTKHKKQVHKV